MAQCDRDEVLFDGAGAAVTLREHFLLRPLRSSPRPLLRRLPVELAAFEPAQMLPTIAALVLLATVRTCCAMPGDDCDDGTSHCGSPWKIMQRSRSPSHASADCAMALSNASSIPYRCVPATAHRPQINPRPETPRFEGRTELVEIPAFALFTALARVALFAVQSRSPHWGV